MARAKGKQTQNKSENAKQLEAAQKELKKLKEQYAKAQKAYEDKNKKVQEVENAKLQTKKANDDSYNAAVEYINNNPSATITDPQMRKRLEGEGYTQVNDIWLKPIPNPSPIAKSNEEFSYANYPATEDTSSGITYPMSEITDLVLVDSISYANNAQWDAFGEPSGSPAPDQTQLKTNKEIAYAKNIEVMSLLNRGFSDNSMTGNLFGLSVDDIGTAISTTDNDSASVLKYNYSGYGDPDDLKRNLFEDTPELANHVRLTGNLNATLAAMSNT